MVILYDLLARVGSAGRLTRCVERRKRKYAASPPCRHELTMPITTEVSYRRYAELEKEGRLELRLVPCPRSGVSASRWS